MRSKPPVSVFGQRLREARLSLAIPQDKLGAMIGLDETTASARISRYETGAHAPPFDIAVRLAHVLGVPVPYFYCDDGELAILILGWNRLSRSGKKRVRTFIDAEAPKAPQSR